MEQIECDEYNNKTIIITTTTKHSNEEKFTCFNFNVFVSFLLFFCFLALVVVFFFQACVCLCA